MAQVQISEPLLDQNFTDRGWRAAFAGQTGVVDDANGSSFGLTLPAEGATAELGSTTQPSRLVVDGYGLEVAQGATQSLDIPASSGGGTNGRTDLIVARLNLSAFTTAPGPVRLHRIAGTEGSTAVPTGTYDQDGIRDLPLYAVRRRQGESLNQAIVTDLRTRAGRNYLVPAGASLPAYASLGDRATRGGTVWRWDFVGSTRDWVAESQPVTALEYSSFTSGAFPGWIQQTTQRLVLDGAFLWVHIEVEKNGGQIVASSDGTIPGHTDIVTLDSAWRPAVAASCSGYVTSDAGARRDAGGQITTGGLVRLTSTRPGATIRTLTLDAFYAKR